MMERPVGLALALLFCMSGGGCGTPAPGGGPGRHMGSFASSLVMPPGGGVSAAWEQGRSDARLNAGGAVLQRGPEWAEVRNRNYTRTSNGQPREFSSTFVRTYSLWQIR